MPKQNLGIISHSALTNHRIIAREGEPYPEMAFHQATPELPDLVHVNAIPGQERSPIPWTTLVKAYGDLAIIHPEYQDRFRAVLKKFCQTEPDDPFVLAALARDRARQGTPEAISAATRELARAIKLGSTSPADFEGLADLLARSAKASEAVSVLERGIALNPYSSRLYKALALLDISVHRYADALETMRKELGLFPEDSFMRMLVKKAEAASRAQVGP
jgi:tetratricopeptide (TPR) repeat protein